MIEQDRIRLLNRRAEQRGDYVLYWMQASQRTRQNPALEHAVRLADARGEPLVVGFGLTDRLPHASRRHHAFLLDGLADVAAALAERGIRFVLRRGSPEDVALDLGRRASSIVMDRGYLRRQRAWRDRLAAEVPCRVVEVEGDVVVPVESASDRREVAARTLRPKLARIWPRYLTALEPGAPKRHSLDLDLDGLDASEGRRLADGLALADIPPPEGIVGGERAARRQLDRFVAEGLDGYAVRRGDPNAMRVSWLSPYLHYGQISPVEVALAVTAAVDGADRAAFLEELIVRRELAVNFVRYTPDYDRYAALPEWARATLAAHAADDRPHRYDAATLEAGETHDPAWNAAMRRMRVDGYLHNHMRMYWGKKILEWSETPEAAFRALLTLNNRWLLDGRDPSSYANCAWIFGLHDRPWPERPIYGTVRCMMASGLKRKMDVGAFVARAP